MLLLCEMCKFITYSPFPSFCGPPRMRQSGQGSPGSPRAPRCCPRTGNPSTSGSTRPASGNVNKCRNRVSISKPWPTRYSHLTFPFRTRRSITFSTEYSSGSESDVFLLILRQEVRRNVFFAREDYDAVWPVVLECSYQTHCSSAHGSLYAVRDGSQWRGI